MILNRCFKYGASRGMRFVKSSSSIPSYYNEAREFFEKGDLARAEMSMRNGISSEGYEKTHNAESKIRDKLQLIAILRKQERFREGEQMAGEMLRENPDVNNNTLVEAHVTYAEILCQTENWILACDTSIKAESLFTDETTDSIRIRMYSSMYLSSYESSQFDLLIKAALQLYFLQHSSSTAQDVSTSYLIARNISTALEYCKLARELCAEKEESPCQVWLENIVKSISDDTSEDIIRSHIATLKLFRREPKVYYELLLSNTSLDSSRLDKIMNSSSEDDFNECPEDSDEYIETSEVQRIESDIPITIPDSLSAGNSDEFVSIKKSDLINLRQKVAELQSVLDVLDKQTK